MFPMDISSYFMMNRHEVIRWQNLKTQDCKLKNSPNSLNRKLIGWLAGEYASSLLQTDQLINCKALSHLVCGERGTL